MARIVTLLLLLMALATFQSCQKCKGTGKNSGIIVSMAPDVLCNSFYERKFVITTQQQMDSINDGECTPSGSIDFSSYTLLVYESSGSCRSNFDREVQIDYASAKYVYTITENSCFCWHKKAAGFNNRVLVPKLPSGYTVDFIERVE